MNIVDSSGWLEFFADGPNAGFFAPAIENTGELLVPTISIYEVFKQMLLRLGVDLGGRRTINKKKGTVVDLDSNLAISAAQLSADLKLPMADSIILATARAHDATIWTQDVDFKDLPGVQYVEKSVQ